MAALSMPSADEIGIEYLNDDGDNSLQFDGACCANVSCFACPMGIVATTTVIFGDPALSAEILPAQENLRLGDPDPELQPPRHRS